MKVLLDTNILIQRENNSILPKNIAQLLQILGELNLSKYIHTLSLSEIQKDGNESRRSINLSKLSAYPIINEYPNYMDDNDFMSKLPEAKSKNDEIDNQLLYCVYKGVASHLITEDQELLHKAEIVGVETVYSVNEAIEIFAVNLPKSNIDLVSTFEEVKPFQIDIKDPIFDSLKESYPEFENTWWKKVVESNRTVYLFRDTQSNKINAILIPKIEDNEEIDCDSIIEKDKYVKICLFKVAPHAQGLKLGEHLLGLAIEFAKLNKINKLYLTHYKEEKDYLLYLIESYGFKLRGKNKRGEEIYIKEIIAPSNILKKISDPLEINRIYYPSFCDGTGVNKFIIPIQPGYHKMLFPKYKHKIHSLIQLVLFKQKDNIKSHGYSIKKAYLSHTYINSMKPGDLLLFYRTEDYHAVTTIGIVEQVYTKITDPEFIKKLTDKRTVFSEDAIKEKCKKETTVILFRWCIHLNNEVRYDYLLKNQIVQGPIQKMQSLTDENYREIIKGNIDERFAIH